MKKIESWADITIGQYQEIMSIQTDNEITKFVESMAICLDIDPEEIRTLSFTDYKDVKTKMSFLSKEPESTVVDRFEVDGVEYGLMPDMRLISAGEFIDAEQFKSNSMDNLHNLVALIYRPIIKTFDDGTFEIDVHKSLGFERRANLFRDKVSIEIVLGAVLFFSLLAMESSLCFLDSLTQKIAKEMSQNTKTKTKTTRTRTKKVNKNPSTKTTDSTT
jgi:hypothetical protein